MTQDNLELHLTLSFSWMVTTNSSKNTKQQRVAHISEHLVTPSNKLTKSLVMYRIKHLNRHVLEPTVIDICKPILKINRKSKLTKNYSLTLIVLHNIGQVKRARGKLVV